ncbi:unnamed protein product [Clonostachys chloroleuca]|uniref:Uncharacterized protein n=1 Tax=Clonostachys chloroleuca TaxID=1926264 RepID=A0AA35Q3Z2_9HYPO|nr:unnamed protein product [Clonostachys chloroleuca]
MSGLSYWAYFNHLGQATGHVGQHSSSAERRWAEKDIKGMSRTENSVQWHLPMPTMQQEISALQFYQLTYSEGCHEEKASER